MSAWVSARANASGIDLDALAPVGLEHGDEAAACERARRHQRGAHLRRVVRVVIVDLRAGGGFSEQLKAAARPGEMGERLALCGPAPRQPGDTPRAPPRRSPRCGPREPTRET